MDVQAHLSLPFAYVRCHKYFFTWFSCHKTSFLTAQLSSGGGIVLIEPRPANLCLRAFPHDKL